MCVVGLSVVVWSVVLVPISSRSRIVSVFVLFAPVVCGSLSSVFTLARIVSVECSSCWASIACAVSLTTCVVMC